VRLSQIWAGNGEKNSALRPVVFADLMLDHCHCFLTTPLLNLELIAIPNFLTAPYCTAWEKLEKTRRHYFWVPVFETLFLKFHPNI